MGVLGARSDYEEEAGGVEAAGDLHLESGESSSWFGGRGADAKDAKGGKDGKDGHAAKPGKRSGIEAMAGGAMRAAFGGRDAKPGKQTLAMMHEHGAAAGAGAAGHMVG